MRETLVARMRRAREEERLARLARLTGTTVEALRSKEEEARRTAEDDRRLREALTELVPVLWQHVEARRAFERWVPKGMGAAETADALADALRRHGSTLAREVTRQVEAVIERAGPSLAAAAAAGPLSSLPAAVAAAGGTSQPYAAPPPMPTSRQVRRIPIDDIQGIIDMLNESQLRGSAQN